MKRAWLVFRSAILWIFSGLHFFLVVPLLILLGIFLDPRKHDWLQRSFCRRIAFLSGAGVEIHRSSGFDAARTSFFMANHVNLFDPFILYCAIPQFVRGWELESHFKIPAYGWLMKRFGNVPVPDIRRPSDLRRMWRLTQAAVNGGTSLIIFPEAKRTRDGQVDQFQDGGFRVAQQLGIPIVPVSLVGSFQHHRTGHWMVWPAKIKVHLHDTIETKGMTKEDVPALRERVREIIAAPVEESLKQDCHRVTGALSGEQQRGPSVAKLPRDRNPS
jgi:1-acyl-sn-glycerol-3-phosphate acyltransferase